MATKKKTKAPPKKPSNGNTAKPKLTGKPNPKGRKLGERIETIREALSVTQIEETRKLVCDLWRQREELEEKKKAAAAEFKSRIAEVTQKIKTALAAASSGGRDVEIVIEEWLSSPDNQVKRYRADTGEQIGDRQARAEDLQERLPGLESDAEEGDEEEDDSDPDLAEQVAEVAKDMADAGDFGD